MPSRGFVQFVEPISVGVERDMDLDVQAIAALPARQVVGGTLTDIIQVVVSEDMQSLQAAWGLK